MLNMTVVQFIPAQVWGVVGSAQCAGVRFRRRASLDASADAPALKVGTDAAE
jgi:hypothetical protein